ncbi:hypothetical protein ACIF8T_38350 [Streptomyces sp. NPDC085946]|uniref:hypothetical protein n=1 Tax=Streptomyces sp. NPDC085946 TaxID=3365744 RepID=UPI0037CE98A2
MPDTARLYALTSTITHPFITGEEGPALLIHDPALAMRWYLAHEQEDNLAVTVQAGDDGGRTWRPLPVHDLLTDTEHALAADDQAALLREALTGLAATWLDRRIRLLPAAGPRSAARRRPDPHRPHSGGRPGHRPRRRVAARARLLERLTYSSELGQLRDRADHAQQQLLQALTGRVLLTATAVAVHPDPRHPVYEAAHAYMRQLASAGTRSHPQPVAQALARAGQTLTDAVAALNPDPGPGSGPVPATAVEGEQPTPLPGFPVHFTDLQAAAAWRALSPLARRDAEMAMEDLVRADAQIFKAAAAIAAWDMGRPCDLAQAAAFDRLSPIEQRRRRQSVYNGEDRALGGRRYIRDRLDDLAVRHALLLHAAVLHDAEQAAMTAKHRAVLTTSTATLPPADTPRTTGESLAEHDAFMAHLTAAENRIDQVLQTQRQMTRDALHRLFPRSGHALGMHELRTRLLDRSRLGLDDHTRAHQQICTTARDLQAYFRRGHTQFGQLTVTEQDLSQARDRHHYAEQYFGDLQESRRGTLLALKALDTVAGLEPTPPGTAAERAARIAAQSRQRARQGPAEEPRTADPAEMQRQHTQHAHPGQHSPAVRPT